MQISTKIFEADFVGWNTFQSCIENILFTPAYISVSISQQKFLIISKNKQNESLMRIEYRVCKQIHAISVGLKTWSLIVRKN